MGELFCCVKAGLIAIQDEFAGFRMTVSKVEDQPS